ncbi:MAG: hypothetical protein JW726_04540 [Anaerolineales bacterium]|nr:hypothetical protein [Anaerolineales bacterium]
MPHPLTRIPIDLRRRFFYILLALTLVIMLVMNFAGLPLNTPAAPLGIVSFEVAGTPQNAQAMLDSWEGALQRAAFIQGLDFLFPLVYSSMLAIGCLMSAATLQASGWPLAKLGAGLAWGQWLAALFDYVENIALVILLFAPAAVSPWPQVATVCAFLKFALILLGMVYGFFGLAARWAGPLRR